MSRQDPEKRLAVTTQPQLLEKVLPLEPRWKCARPTLASDECRAPMPWRAGAAYCIKHDPEATDINRAAVLKGGSRTARPRRRSKAPTENLRTPEQIVAYHEETATKFARDELSKSDVATRTRIAAVAFQIYQGNVGEKLAEVERLVERARRSGRLHSVRTLHLGAP